MPLPQVRALGSASLERTVLERQGEPCLPLGEIKAPTRKRMAYTRPSAAPMTNFATL